MAYPWAWGNTQPERTSRIELPEAEGGSRSLGGGQRANEHGLEYHFPEPICRNYLATDSHGEAARSLNYIACPECSLKIPARVYQVDGDVSVELEELTIRECPDYVSPLR